MLVIHVQIKDSKLAISKQSAFVSFVYDEDAINKIKNIPGRRYHAREKCWEIPEEMLDELKHVFSEEKLIIEQAHPMEFHIPDDYVFKTPPLEHQREGIEYGLNHSKFLLCDEQGLGKTYQSLHIAAIRHSLYRDEHALIICGVNGLKYNWLREVEKHTFEKAYILGTRYTKKGTRKTISTQYKMDDVRGIAGIEPYFLITNLESFRNPEFAEAINELCKMKKISSILFDEIQMCKNPSSKAAKNLLKVCCENFICMTGTPIVNNPLDVYVSLRLMEVENRNYWSFRNYYTVTKEIQIPGRKSFQIPVGYRHLEEIQQKIANNYIRRRKEDVLNLPAKIYCTERLEMLPAQKHLYDEVVDDILSDTSIATVDNALAKFIRLRQITGAPDILSSIKESIKLERMEQIVEERVANDRKVIIFTNWAEVAKRAFHQLKDYMPALIIGEVKVTDREVEKERFMNDDACKVIIGTIGTLGTGFTLTAADTVIFLDSPWTKALKSQAEDRAHRIGTSHPVTILTLVCAGTIDERVEEIVEQKGDISNLMIEFKSVGKMVEYMVGKKE